MRTALACAVVAATSACGGDAVPGRNEAGDQAWEHCVHDPGGYAVSYPAGWLVNDGSVTPVCSLFDPARVTVVEGSEFPEDIAVSLHVEAVPFDSIVAADFGMRILSQDSLELMGQRAIRRLFEHTGDGLYDRGLVTWQYVVDRGDGTTFIATSHNAGEPAFAEKRQVLDRMMQALRRR
jgi:hypothetical protein